MAKFGNEHPNKTLIVAGVRFMGETAKILNPEKRVLMPTLEAECSLDLSCSIDEFDKFCDEHPDAAILVHPEIWHKEQTGIACLEDKYV